MAALALAFVKAPGFVRGFAIAAVPAAVLWAVILSPFYL